MCILILTVVKMAVNSQNSAPKFVGVRPSAKNWQFFQIVLDPKDERLLEEDWETRAGTDKKRSKQHSLGVSWMRRPDYISTEQARYQPTTIEKIESRVGFGIRKKMGNDMGNFMDREAQIEKIEKTFDDVKNEITEHHSKKGNILPRSKFTIFFNIDLKPKSSTTLISRNFLNIFFRDCA